MIRTTKVNTGNQSFFCRIPIIAFLLALPLLPTTTNAQESTTEPKPFNIEAYIERYAPTNVSLLPIQPVTEIAPTGNVADVVAYYEEHEQELVTLFKDASRARALFAMYTVHIAKPYGESMPAVTLDQYILLSRAHCGIYTPVQQQISEALGLETRNMYFTDGWHGWLEVNINGQWEIFDSTTNTWINRGMSAMLSSEPRQYKFYYTPVLDRSALAVFRAHLQEGPRPGYYSTPSLRATMPFFGLDPDVEYPPLGILCETCDRLNLPLANEDVRTQE
jgi:hypothetical protein